MLKLSHNFCEDNNLNINKQQLIKSTNDLMENEIEEFKFNHINEMNCEIDKLREFHMNEINSFESINIFLCLKFRLSRFKPRIN